MQAGKFCENCQPYQPQLQKRIRQVQRTPPDSPAGTEKFEVKMFDLWESLTSNLFRLYQKRKADLYDDSEARILNKARTQQIKETWHTIGALPKHKHDNRNDTVEAIVARTQQILARSVEASVTEKINLWKYKQLQIEKGEIAGPNDDENDSVGGRGVNTSTTPRSTTDEGSALRGVAKGPYLNRPRTPPPPTAEEDADDRVFPLVQKVGLAVEHKKRVLSSSDAANNTFVEMTMAEQIGGVGGSSSPLAIREAMAAVGSNNNGGALITDHDTGESDNNHASASCGANNKNSYYPATLPKRCVNSSNSGDNSADADPTAATYVEVPIDWEKVQKEVADELAAMERRDAIRYAQQRKNEAAFEESVRALMKQEAPHRVAQVKEINTRAAAAMRAGAHDAANATVDSNRLFEAMLSGEGPKMVPAVADDA